MFAESDFALSSRSPSTVLSLFWTDRNCRCPAGRTASQRDRISSARRACPATRKRSVAFPLLSNSQVALPVVAGLLSMSTSTALAARAASMLSAELDDWVFVRSSVQSVRASSRASFPDSTNATSRLSSNTRTCKVLSPGSCAGKWSVEAIQRTAMRPNEWRDMRNIVMGWRKSCWFAD